MSERWQPVTGYEGSYEVSDRGRVRSIGRTIPHRKTKMRTLPTRILSQKMTGRNGRLYPTVELRSADHRRHPYKVHRLILEAFIGPRPENHQACHANDDPTDNRLENLRWDTRSANIYDAVRNGRHPQSRKTSCRHGHEFTPENTYTRPDGGRNCRACQVERQHRYIATRP